MDYDKGSCHHCGEQIKRDIKGNLITVNDGNITCFEAGDGTVYDHDICLVHLKSCDNDGYCNQCGHQ